MARCSSVAVSMSLDSFTTDNDSINSSGTTTYTYSAPNRYSSITDASSVTTSFAYDDEGNMLEKTRQSDSQKTEYTWDYRDRLTNVIVKNSTGSVIAAATYTYDVFNRRIIQSVDADGAGSGAAVVTKTVYDAVQPPTAEQLAALELKQPDRFEQLPRAGEMKFFGPDNWDVTEARLVFRDLRFDPLRSDLDGDGWRDTMFLRTTRPAEGPDLGLVDVGFHYRLRGPDADADGLPDAAEDLDGDGVVGAGETDPADTDSDDDGLNDGDEVARGTDPLDGDADDDCYGDAVEAEAGSDPNDPASVPTVVGPVTLPFAATGAHGPVPCLPHEV